MKICDIINEDYGMQTQQFVPNDLSPFHVFVLKKIASGDLNIENASEKASDAMYELEAGGILDNFGELTEHGKRVFDALNREGGSLDKRNSALRRRPERGELRRRDNMSGMNEPVAQGY